MAAVLVYYHPYLLRHAQFFDTFPTTDGRKCDIEFFLDEFE